MKSNSIHTLAAAVAAIAVLCAVPAAAQTKIRAGVAAYNEALLPVVVAQEQGYLKAEKIEVELINFKGGGPTVQAFVGGSVDLCMCAADHVVRLRSRNQPAIVLIGLDAFHSYALIGKANGPADLAALKGKTVGITSPGSLTDNTLRYAISELKLNPDRDFQIVGAGVGGAMISAIESGKVDAGMAILTDIAFMMQKKGVFKVVKEFRDMPYPSFAALALESWVAKNPEAARGFNRAVRKAMADLRRDPALGRATIKKMYPNFSDDLAAEVSKSAIERAPQGGLLSAESIRNLNSIVTTADTSLKPVAYGDAVKPDLLRD